MTIAGHVTIAVGTTRGAACAAVRVRAGRKVAGRLSVHPFIPARSLALSADGGWLGLAWSVGGVWRGAGHRCFVVSGSQQQVSQLLNCVILPPVNQGQQQKIPGMIGQRYL